MPVSTHQLNTSRRRLSLAGIVAALCALGCWFEWRAYASARDSLETKTTRHAAFITDIERIGTLQSAPRRATDRRMPHDALVERIDQALRRAKVDARALTNVWPESPQRTLDTMSQGPAGGSDYLSLTTRLTFEKVSLEQITRFTHTLLALDASLRLTSIRLLSQQHPKPLWDVELAVTYLIYAPRRQQGGAVNTPTAIGDSPDDSSENTNVKKRT